MLIQPYQIFFSNFVLKFNSIINLYILILEVWIFQYEFYIVLYYKVMGSSVQINKLNRINKSTSGYVSLSLLPRLKKKIWRNSWFTSHLYVFTDPVGHNPRNFRFLCIRRYMRGASSCLMYTCTPPGRDVCPHTGRQLFCITVPMVSQNKPCFDRKYWCQHL